jgi:hypothetical protein|tara:strand:- start:26 stop:1291 length:1266 start_codon:yes stop_codon:yes gene_type:complete
MLGHGSCKLFKISESKKEFEKLCRTLTGENKKADISPELINKSLMEEVNSQLSSDEEVYLIHDPSDIRKPYSKELGSLGKVRDLKGNIINGYSSYNVVAITPNDKSVHLLSHRSYSNKDAKFLKSEHIKKLNEKKDFDGIETAQKLYESGDYFNKKILAREEISRVSTELKAVNSTIKITHILDREFDDDDYYTLIHSKLNDSFVVRVKKSRVLEERDNKGKSIKLITSDFAESYQIPVKKIQFKDKVYQDAVIHIAWREFNGYKVTRVTIKNRKGNEIFKEPMLLITNKTIDSGEDAYGIYLIYLKRSKIEYVFRFLKDGLGWEEIQIRDFNGIQNLLSLCFYVSAYLYEIGEEIAYDDFAILLAEIGGGKGKVTRHYIFEGIKMLLGKIRIERIFEERKISKEAQERLKCLAGADLIIE